MKAADVMVSAVISVRPNARVEEVASILLASRISAVPVIDEQGELLGIVSEGDLMRRAEAGTDRSRSWWLEYLTGKTGARRGIREIAFAQGHRCHDAFGDHRNAGDAAQRDCNVA